MVANPDSARPAPRYIQAWNHAGDSTLIHAAVDQPRDRSRIALGCMGISTVTACRQEPNGGLPFMRLERSDDDSPTRGVSGWIIDWDFRGREWDTPLRGEGARRCVRCVRALRPRGDA